MEPTAKFNTYPATIRAWFVTYEEARRKLQRAVEKTDLESDANEDKANRGLRKRKHFTDLSSSEDETDKNPTKVGKSDSASHKGNSLVLPTFTFSLLPEETVSSVSQSISDQTKENATTDKSQRSVLGIADINEKVENNNVLSSLESVRSPSNSNSNDFLITAKGGNNICTNFEKTDPRATSSPREHASPLILLVRMTLRT
ncbi:PREDICTED: uncharacterized protein LOC108764870 [Trachymyrmex cornetzi]|uniref:uncharacterized protein LOC108764870 n=1 Tax=Trachymyrmex cornetzi TaxID=471704 RepID=UPI00084EE5E1|nr:PREDICTED: uncharacterized protein LOC108764870 [Trachymyrmex cornetzi]